MATYETYKQCENALNELITICHNSKNNLFITAANLFQEIFENIPNYYKANQQELITLTKELKQLKEKINVYEKYFWSIPNTTTPTRLPHRLRQRYRIYHRREQTDYFTDPNDTPHLTLQAAKIAVNNLKIMLEQIHKEWILNNLS